MHGLLIVALLAAMPQPWIDFGDERVFAIKPHANQHLEVVTARGRRVVNASGEVVRKTDFRPDVDLFPAVAGAGYDWDARSLLPFRDDGSVQGRVPMRQGETFSVGNEQVVVADRRAIRMHALDGTLLRRLTIGEYVTDLAHNDEELIVHTYPGPKRQGVFRVLGAEGRELAKWTVAPAVAGFSIVAADDGPAILTVTKDGFALQSTEGRELRRFPVALGKGFARALGTKLSGDTWVLVAVGSGYHSKTSVTVFTGDRLVYRDDVEGRSYALTASGDDAFLLGIEDVIWRYELPRPHRVP